MSVSLGGPSPVGRNSGVVYDVWRILPPEWSRKIVALRHALNLSQHDFAEKLNMSAMAVSRWERALLEPTARAYIRLGILSDDPLSWFFWQRAGLSTADIMRVLPAAEHRLSREKLDTLKVVHAGPREKAPKIKPTDFVAIPVLPVDVATLGERTEEVKDLDQLKPESLWAAPASWCPNPAKTISLRVKGNSMSPLILNGYLIAVDTSKTSREKLRGQIIVAWSKKTRQLVVSRLLSFDHTDALVSDHREYQSVSLAAESGWRIVGKVLWWAGKPN
jgi:transcriptional regulator with XRE-family HTH domain